MYRLLIVEDQSWTRKSLVQMIDCNLLNLSVVEEAANGIEGYEWIKKGGIHILVTDIRMPGMDGLELARRVREEYPEIKVIILSGHNEFEYAQTALRHNVCDYLLKPVQPKMLNQTILTAIQALSSSMERERNVQRVMLRQILEGTPAHDVDPEDHYLSSFSGTWTRMIRMKGKKIDQIDSCLLSIQKTLTSRQIKVIPLMVEQGWSLFVSSAKPYTNKEIADFLTESDIWSQFPNLHLGIGLPYSTLETLWISELESILALELFKESQPIYLYDPASLLKFKIDQSTIADLWTALESNQLIQFNHYLVQWFPEHLANSEIRYRCFVLIKSLISRKQSEPDIDYFYLIKTLQTIIRNMTYAEQELSQWVKSTFYQAYQMLMSNKDKTTEHIIGWCQTYIMNNLEDDISLTGLAERLHFSPSHLSNLFKQFTGINFIDYVMELKIAKAKKYLEDTTMKISEIAYQLGYEDGRYFSKLFRKMVGLTPSEYKLSKTGKNG
jgi:two-component system response regulator YesN